MLIIVEKIVTEELNRHGWREPELVVRGKGDKVKIAGQAVAEGNDHEWIARRLEMGSWTYIDNLLVSERGREQR